MNEKMREKARRNLNYTADGYWSTAEQWERRYWDTDSVADKARYEYWRGRAARCYQASHRLWCRMYPQFLHSDAIMVLESKGKPGFEDNVRELALSYHLDPCGVWDYLADLDAEISA